MRPFRRNLIAALALLAMLAVALAASPAAAAKRALFDNFHAEQAGNADWVIDDNQPTPSPLQAAIVPSTPRTYWTGAISSWGVDLVKRGFTVTINNAAFTYGNAANPLDLSNFDVLIVPEPNTVFSASEKTALLSFVHAGGGLIAVGDHHISDRNNDGFDSPMIWNALDPALLLGVHWGTAGDVNNNIVQTSSNLNAAPSDSITHGPVGVAPGLAFHNGTTFTISPATNPSVRGEVWMIGVAQTSTTSIMAASSRYGSGRVFFLDRRRQRDSWQLEHLRRLGGDRRQRVDHERHDVGVAARAASGRLHRSLGDAGHSPGRRVVGHGLQPRHHVDRDRRRGRDVRGRGVVGARNGRPVAGDRA